MHLGYCQLRAICRTITRTLKKEWELPQPVELTVGGHNAAGPHDQSPLQCFLGLPPVWKISINFPALRLRNTLQKSLVRLFLTQAEFTTYLFPQISATLTSTLLIGPHCVMSSVSQAAIRHFFRFLAYSFMHSGKALHCLGRNEWRNHMTCHWKLKKQTKRQQQARTNSVCYELLNALLGNHKAITELSLKSPAICEFGLWKNHMPIRPTDMINRRVLQWPKVI